MFISHRIFAKTGIFSTVFVRLFARFAPLGKGAERNVKQEFGTGRCRRVVVNNLRRIRFSSSFRAFFRSSGDSIRYLRSTCCRFRNSLGRAYGKKKSERVKKTQSVIKKASRTSRGIVEKFLVRTTISMLFDVAKRIIFSANGTRSLLKRYRGVRCTFWKVAVTSGRVSRCPADFPNVVAHCFHTRGVRRSENATKDDYTQRLCQSNWGSKITVCSSLSTDECVLTHSRDRGVRGKELWIA